MPNRKRTGYFSLGDLHYPGLPSRYCFECEGLTQKPVMNKKKKSCKYKNTHGIALTVTDPSGPRSCWFYLENGRWEYAGERF